MEKNMNYSILANLINRTLHGNGDSDRHQITLLGLILASKSKNILELGVRQGITTLPLLTGAHLVDGFVHSVDIDQTSFQCPDELKKHWMFYKSDAIKFLETKSKENAKYDFVYIDDWHSYDHVKKELELISDMVSPSSMILLHDLMYSGTHPNYHSNLNDPDPQWANGGPYRAVAELDPKIWEWATIPFNHGLTLLRKKGNIIS
jgi:predicted O-methyltransferase YrrM